jgi:hypothetical protein
MSETLLLTAISYALYYHVVERKGEVPPVLNEFSTKPRRPQHYMELWSATRPGRFTPSEEAHDAH